MVAQGDTKGSKGGAKGLNSLVILLAWTLWKHRKRCVFDGVTPPVSIVLHEASEQAHLWTLAGAKALRELLEQAG
jgi:hypothetical protein